MKSKEKANSNSDKKLENLRRLLLDDEINKKKLELSAVLKDLAEKLSK